MIDVPLSHLAERVPVGAGDDDVVFHPPAQLALGLIAGQARPRARRPLLAELSLDAARADAPGAVPGFTPSGVPVGEQPTAAVGALAHGSAPPRCRRPRPQHPANSQAWVFSATHSSNSCLVKRTCRPTRTHGKRRVRTASYIQLVFTDRSRAASSGRSNGPPCVVRVLACGSEPELVEGIISRLPFQCSLDSNCSREPDAPGYGVSRPGVVTRNGIAVNGS